MAANANLSLRQLATPDLNQQPLCITFPTLEANATFELKSGLIHLLLAFHGLAGEDPYKHLMEFYVVCASMKPHGVTEDQIQLRAFTFSLKNAAKDWLYYLPFGSITTWMEIKRIFLEKYFPASRAANIRKEIYGCKQFTGESLLENMVDAASRGVFVDKTPEQAKDLIKNMTANSQKFGTNRIDSAPIRSNEVNATGGFPGPPQQKYDPYSNTYNPGWKDRPNLRYGNPQETQASIQQLNTQMGQLETAVNRLEALNSNSLPSQTVVNPKENVSAITLRIGKELKVNEEVVKEQVQNEDEEKSKEEEDEIVPIDAQKALKESRKDEGIKGLYEVFRRCERKHKLKGCQKVELGENVSAVVQRKAPKKCKDPGMFSIPCKIGDVQLDTTMLDLGVSINVMSYSVYASLNYGPLTETAIVIQLADKSTIYPRGLLEDILMQVGNLVFPADFYMLDMKSNDLNSPILLGRPFLKTSKSIIDVNNDTLTMEFDGEIVNFHIFDTLQIPDCESVVNNLDAINHLSQEHKEVVSEGKLKEVITQLAKNSIAEIFMSDLQASGFDLEVNESDVAVQVLNRGWGTFFKQPPPAIVPIVREFYANAAELVDGKAFIRGTLVYYAPNDLNILLETPDVDDSLYQSIALASDLHEVLQQLCFVRAAWLDPVYFQML
ncbi:uncharacterized protein [Henckelia pumila]|uniref:uncharacterized protein n=1 Tax=Henckelia pumila TaxID=405737 RepID=UPI003C6E3425